MEVSLDDKKIIETYNILSSKSHRYYNDMCKSCYQYNNCGSESFYTGGCLMIDLYNKIHDILNYKVEPTPEEL